MTDAELRATAAAWLASGRTARVVQVLRHRGSVPREAGTRMLVAADAVAGSIGGGHLEWQAMATARVRLADHDAQTHDRDIALGPSLGQCCGGALTLRCAPLDAAALAAWPETAPLFTLQLYGAGHVGRAIVALLAGLACRVRWVDARADAFGGDGPLPPHIQPVSVEPLAADLRAVVHSAPTGALHLVLTHSHALDLMITEAVLRDGRCGWLGLIGSATKRARFGHRLAERGLAPEAIARITCPVGVPGIPGKQPEVIAVAVVAQLLQLAAGQAAMASESPVKAAAPRPAAPHLSRNPS